MADRILIVEDDLYQRSMLAGHLAELDCEISQCATSAQALAVLDDPETRHDLAIVSTRLPGKGQPLFRQIIQRYGELPIVLLSDRGSLREVTLALRQGAYDYLIKPFESLEDVGFRVSRALERAHLVRENREYRFHMEHELTVARSVQEHLLPRTFPYPDRVQFAANYTACTAVGGDLYDCFALDNDHVGAYIFDVSGHGPSAALVSTILKMSVESFVERDACTAIAAGEATRAALADVNPRLKRLTDPSQFATMIYTVLDMARGRLAFTSAGHCHPIVIDPEGHAISLTPRQGFPLGIVANAVYSQDIADFPIGSTLFLYTDGVTEAMDPGFNQWGMTSLLEAVSRHASKPLDGLVAAIMSELRAFTRRDTFKDDVTILALRFLR